MTVKTDKDASFTKIFSIWDENGSMIAGPLGEGNALLLGIVIAKPLDKLSADECIKGTVQRAYQRTATFYVRRDK